MLITISRQYLAGAPAVARRIADGLGWTVVDDDFIGAIAEKSGLSEDDVASLEENVPTFLERFAQSSALSFPEFLVSTPFAIEEPDSVKLAHVTRELIEELPRRPFEDNLRSATCKLVFRQAAIPRGAEKSSSLREQQSCHG